MRLVIIIKRVILFLLLASVWSCGKDGMEGPMGPAGPQGEKGDQGAKGADGTMLRYGSGSPIASVGMEGDFYIDVKNNNLYGPKKGNSWGDPISMKGSVGATGSTGAAGKDGSQFLSGNTDPANTVGKTGDFYFNKTSGILFGPKAASGWAAGVMLKGSKGDKGDKGEKGDPGKDGNANVITMGWTIVTTPYWKNIRGYTSDGIRWYLAFDRPGDKGLRVVEDLFIANTNRLTGAILVYGDNGTGSRMLPFEDRLNARGHTATLEHRFVFTSNRVYIVVALRDGTWDVDYVMNTYLPSIRWKVVLIPEGIAKSNSGGLSQLNLNNYEAVSRYLNLSD